jgi:addiction module HigA family antidote
MGTDMALMHNPPHPGETLKEDVLPAMELTQGEAADQLGMSRSAFTRVLNGHAAISPDLALRLGEWLGTSAEVWAKAQMQYDLWKAQEARKMQKMKIQRVSRPAKKISTSPRTRSTTSACA